MADFSPTIMEKIMGTIINGFVGFTSGTLGVPSSFSFEPAAIRNSLFSDPQVIAAAARNFDQVSGASAFVLADDVATGGDFGGAKVSRGAELLADSGGMLNWSTDAGFLKLEKEFRASSDYGRLADLYTDRARRLRKRGDFAAAAAHFKMAAIAASNLDDGIKKSYFLIVAQAETLIKDNNLFCAAKAFTNARSRAQDLRTPDRDDRLQEALEREIAIYTDNAFSGLSNKSIAVAYGTLAKWSREAGRNHKDIFNFLKAQGDFYSKENLNDKAYTAYYEALALMETLMGDEDRRPGEPLFREVGEKISYLEGLIGLEISAGLLGSLATVADDEKRYFEEWYLKMAEGRMLTQIAKKDGVQNKNEIFEAALSAYEEAERAITELITVNVEKRDGHYILDIDEEMLERRTQAMNARANILSLMGRRDESAALCKEIYKLTDGLKAYITAFMRKFGLKNPLIAG